MRLADEVEALLAMRPAELRAAWQTLYRDPVPMIGPDLLRRAIAGRMQERVHGGLPLAARRDITAMIARLNAGKALMVEREIRLKVGTRLVREWRGRSYHVLVCDPGFEFEGQRYDSLTQIARAITGTHWSGPRFFGLHSNKVKSGYKEAVP